VFLNPETPDPSKLDNEVTFDLQATRRKSKTNSFCLPSAGLWRLRTDTECI